MRAEVIAFPLPFLTFLLASVAAVLIARQDFGAVPARDFFVAFFAVTAPGGLLAGLRFGTGHHRPSALQRAIPLSIGPCLYLGFASPTTSEDGTRRLAAVHLGSALVLAFLPQFVPSALAVFDALIGAS